MTVGRETKVDREVAVGVEYLTWTQRSAERWWLAGFWRLAEIRQSSCRGGAVLAMACRLVVECSTESGGIWRQHGD